MTKRRVNILSNELDQAPKTRAAGYGKVVDSMRKEIINAMDRIFVDWNDSIRDYMDNSNNIPWQQLSALKPWERLSFEIKREKIEPDEWFMKAVWHPAFLWNFNNFTSNCLFFSEEWPLKPGEISSIIVVEADEKDPKLWKIHAEQLEFPGKWAMLMEWMFFHNPDVSDEDFQEIIWTNKEKEEMKEQLKENIKEEIEIEAEEEREKEEEKVNQKKPDEKKSEKSLSDRIKWWFK